MAATKDKVQNALDEARMLVLGSQVLFGFQLRSAFEPGFDALPPLSKWLSAGALVALVVTFALLMAPGAFHQIAERGEATERVHRFATRLATAALLPFAAALGAACFVGSDRIVGRSWGAAFGLLVGAAALVMWFGIEAAHRVGRAPDGGRTMEERREGEGTQLTDKIREVLTEARVVLPGAQALLGFQLIAVLADSFERQPQWLKGIHLSALAFVAVATILLMTPAAYHRIVEDGEDSERFHRFSARTLLTAMAVLPLGVCADVLVVTVVVTGKTWLAAAAAAGLLALCYGLWFGYTFACRARRTRVPRPSDRLAA